MKSKNYVKYICEYCGKEYDKAALAVKCEEECIKKLEANKKNAEKEEALKHLRATIDGAIKETQDYYLKYKEIPSFLRTISTKRTNDNLEVNLGEKDKKDGKAYKVKEQEDFSRLIREFFL